MDWKHPDLGMEYLWKKMPTSQPKKIKTITSLPLCDLLTKHKETLTVLPKIIVLVLF